MSAPVSAGFASPGGFAGAAAAAVGEAASAYGDWVAGSALGHWLAAAWTYPLLETVHIVAIALLVGPIVLVDLRLLGVRRRGRIGDLLRLALPVSIAGFALAVASGLLLFSNEPATLVANRAFVVKMGLIAAAGLNALSFHAMLRRAAAGASGPADDAPPAIGLRVAGAASLLLWTAAIGAGRMIAYV